MVEKLVFLFLCCVTYRFIDGQLIRQVLTQAHVLHIRAREGLVAAGARVKLLGVVLDQKVLRPVPWTSPSTTFHLKKEKNGNIRHRHRWNLMRFRDGDITSGKISLADVFKKL